jgi:hypothetical protein
MNANRLTRIALTFLPCILIPAFSTLPHIAHSRIFQEIHQQRSKRIKSERNDKVALGAYSDGRKRSSLMAAMRLLKKAGINSGISGSIGYGLFVYPKDHKTAIHLLRSANKRLHLAWIDKELSDNRRSR